MTEQCISVKDTALAPDETDEQYQERVVIQCLEELFRRTQVPVSVTGRVWEVIERHGVWTGLAVSKLVIDAFEAGRKWGAK